MARGHIVVNKSTTIHGVPLGANIHLIAVKTAVNSDTPLPFPIGDEFVYIKDVVDNMVPWPKHLVFLSTTPKVKIILL